MVVFIWMFFLYFLLPLKFLTKCQTNKHPSALLLVLTSLVSLCACPFVWQAEVFPHLCRTWTLWVSEAGDEDSSSVIPHSQQGSKAEMRKSRRNSKSHTLAERERANIHLTREAPQMLRGFDISADGHWPDLGLIMHSPVAEKKAWVHKLPSEHKQESNRSKDSLNE